MQVKLLVIGATRGIGRCLVEQALDEGHSVRALVRDPGRMPARHDRLDVIAGDIRDKEAVRRAVADQEAVCITVGIHPTRKPVYLFSVGAQNVIDAMTGSATNFLICVTGIGAGDSKHHGGFFYDKIIHPLLLKTIYADKDRQEALMQKLGFKSVDWTSLGMLLTVCLALLLLSLSVILFIQREPDQVRRCYQRFCNKLSRKGIRIHANEGPRDFARRIRKQKPELAMSAGKVLRLYRQLRYEPEGGNMKAFCQAVKDFH